MQLIVWEYFEGSYREYLIYQFDNNGNPLKTCSVAPRDQGCPSKHLLTLTDGTTILDKCLGRDMKTGLYVLPKQYHNIKAKEGLLELSSEAFKPSEHLPEHCWFQYDRVRIKWELVKWYYPLRDFGADRKSCYVYKPVRIVL